jgi:hypothetical protein
MRDIMKSHSGTHSGTAVSGLGTVNFSHILKRGKEIKYRDFIW